MNIGQILTDIGSGLASIVPVFFGAIWEGFAVLFLTYTEAEGVMTVTGFNALGSLCLAFAVLGICYKIIPAILRSRLAVIFLPINAVMAGIIL